MQDRLGDMLAMNNSRDLNETELHEIPIDIDDIPAGLQNFNDAVDRIKREMGVIKANMATLSQGYRTMLLAADTEQQDVTNKLLENATENIIKNVGQQLKNMSEDNKIHTDHQQWRTNLHSLLTKQFMEILINYREMQSDHEQKVKERIRTRVKIVNPAATDEEVERIVDSAKNMNIFEQELASEKTTQAKEALFFVEERHREILKIEQSVLEIHKLFNDMAVLVNMQGEYLDNIEHNVSLSKAHVAEANIQLASALRKKNRRRWTWCILCMVFILILVAGGLVLGFVGKSQNWW